MPLFLNGTPKVSTATLEGGKGAIVNGDIYFGYCGSPANVDNFVGTRWNNTTSNWQCGVRTGGSDSGTWANITGGTNDANTHIISWRTDGTANKLYCSFDGGAEVSPTSPTFPTFTRIVTLLGTPSGITVIRLGQIGVNVAK